MPHKIKFVPYRSRVNGKNYWRMIAGNGKKVAAGCEPFAKKISRAEFERMKKIWASAEYCG